MAAVRTYLRGREYSALQTLFGMVSTMEVCGPMLEERCRAAGCWDTLQEAQRLAEKCMDGILATVPENKLRHIRTDLSHIRMIVKTEAPGISTPVRGYSYTPTDTLNDLLNYMVQHECSMCDKTAQEARKCPYRLTIEESLPHEVDGSEREYCRFSDMVLGVEGA